MKKAFKIFVIINIIIILIVSIILGVTHSSIFIYSESFLKIRPAYLYFLSFLFVVSLFIIRKKKELSNIKSLIIQTALILLIGYSSTFAIGYSLPGNIKFENYTLITNDETGEEYILHKNHLLGTGMFILEKLKYNIILTERQYAGIESDTSVTIKEITWEAPNNLILKCDTFDHFDNEAEQKEYRFEINK